MNARASADWEGVLDSTSSLNYLLVILSSAFNLLLACYLLAVLCWNQLLISSIIIKDASRILCRKSNQQKRSAPGGDATNDNDTNEPHTKTS